MRYALKATNARWGSLYDALYGSDVISEDDGASRQREYNPRLGGKVIAYVNSFLDQSFPLEGASHAEVMNYVVHETPHSSLTMQLTKGHTTHLVNAAQFGGFVQENYVKIIVLLNNCLHIELVVYRDHPVGRQNPAGLADVILEAAVTTIQDCEDSVAAIDADDKVVIYRNWLGLMSGNLESEFEKGGKEHIGHLAGDRHYTAIDGTSFALSGRSLLLIRNVGLHLMTDPVLPSGVTPERR